MLLRVPAWDQGCRLAPEPAGFPQHPTRAARATESAGPRVPAHVFGGEEGVRAGGPAHCFDAQLGVARPASPADELLARPPRVAALPLSTELTQPPALKPRTREAPV